MRAARESHLATLMQHHTRWTACLTNDVPARAPLGMHASSWTLQGAREGMAFWLFTGTRMPRMLLPRCRASLLAPGG